MQLQALNWLNIVQVNLFLKLQLTVAVAVDVGWMGVKCKLCAQQCFITPFTILLVVIHSSKNKMKKIDGFAVIFDGIQLSQIQI